MIRGGVYRVDLGEAKRGHEQRGRRYGLVISPSSSPLSVATIIPASTSAKPSVVRPEVEIAGVRTRFLVDQIRTVDVSYILGDLVYYLDRCEMADVENALVHYLGI